MAQKTVADLLQAVATQTAASTQADAAFDQASAAKDAALVAKNGAKASKDAAVNEITAGLPANRFYDAGNGQVAAKIDGVVVIDTVHPGAETVEVPDPSPASDPVAPPAA